MSSPVAPEIAFTLLICASKSAAVFIAAVPIPTIGVVTLFVSVLPSLVNPSPAFAIPLNRCVACDAAD